MPGNTSCTNTTCPQKCCTLSGNCVNANSTQPAQRFCKFFYNQTEWQPPNKGKVPWEKQTKGSIQQDSTSNFPVYYAVPLIVIGSLLIVLFCILAYRCWKKKKQQKESSCSRSSGDDKLTQIYHQAFSQSSASDLMPYGISQNNLGPPPSARNPYLYPYPHPHNNPYNIYNPHMQINYQQFQVPLQPMPVSSNIGNWRVYQQNLNHPQSVLKNPYFYNHTETDVRQSGLNAETDGNQVETQKGETDNGNQRNEKDKVKIEE